jgi:hypothetical protein
LKNRRGNHYANGWLDVPAKYNYLKGNSQKRNPMGSRRKKALSAAAAALAKERKRNGAQAYRGARKIVADDDEDDEENDEEDDGDENAMHIEGEGEDDMDG